MAFKPKFDEWTVPLYNITKYHLWSKPQSEILDKHHGPECLCKSGNPSQCYEVGRKLIHVSTFRDAHQNIEYGFFGYSTARISIVNDPALDPDPAWNRDQSPFYVKGNVLYQHPFEREKQIWLDIDTESSFGQIQKSRKGNVAFNFTFPASLILSQKFNLYLIEFAEYREKTCARYFLTRSTFELMTKCDISTLGGPIYFDGQKLHVLKKCKNIIGNFLPLYHEITADETVFPYLDQKCSIGHHLPRFGRDKDEINDKVFGMSDRMENLTEYLQIYGKLLNLYQNKIICDVLNDYSTRISEDMELTSEEIHKLAGYKPIGIDPDEFNLTKHLYAAPNQSDGLLRNCIKIYQTLYN